MSDNTEFINRVKEALANNKIISDGHTIFDVEFYAPYFSEAVLKKAKLIQTFKSDLSSHKSTIYDNNGEVLKSLKGIYNLDFLYWVCSNVGVTKRSDKGGRGSIASDYVRFINEIVNPISETV